ncbi:MAG: radical SAM protein, partial [Planctomycetes bacterium]|nr:radical SAM protein [Planctomycetota bacterium]
MSAAGDFSPVVKALEVALIRYPGLPPEAIVKQDLLRLGIAFDPEALSGSEDHKKKDYFIFSFDRVAYGKLDSHELKAPEEIRLSGGELGLSPTVVSVRIDPASPYRVGLREGRRGLWLGGFFLGEVEYQGRPAYHDRVLSSGRRAGEVVP